MTSNACVFQKNIPKAQGEQNFDGKIKEKALHCLHRVVLHSSAQLGIWGRENCPERRPFLSSPHTTTMMGLFCKAARRCFSN